MVTRALILLFVCSVSLAQVKNLTPHKGDRFRIGADTTTVVITIPDSGVIFNDGWRAGYQAAVLERTDSLIQLGRDQVLSDTVDVAVSGRNWQELFKLIRRGR